jgi:cytoskeletal protein RodZ
MAGASIAGVWEDSVFVPNKPKENANKQPNPDAHRKDSRKDSRKDNREDDRKHRKAMKRKMCVPLSITYLLECSLPVPLYYRLPKVTDLADPEPPEEDPSPTPPASTVPAAGPTAAAANSSANKSTASTSTTTASNVTKATAAKATDANPAATTPEPPKPVRKTRQERVKAANLASYSRMLTMGVQTIRDLSDLELVEDRLFCQVFNEHKLILFLLPRAPEEKPVGSRHYEKPTEEGKEKPAMGANQTSAEDYAPEDFEQLNRHLDGMMAAFFLPGTRHPSLRTRWDYSSYYRPGLQWEVLDATGRAQLPVLVFVCSKDHFVHPTRVPPSVMAVPRANVLSELVNPLPHRSAASDTRDFMKRGGFGTNGISDGRPLRPWNLKWSKMRAKEDAARKEHERKGSGLEQEHGEHVMSDETEHGRKVSEGQEALGDFNTYLHNQSAKFRKLMELGLDFGLDKLNDIVGSIFMVRMLTIRIIVRTSRILTILPTRIGPAARGGRGEHEGQAGRPVGGGSACSGPTPPGPRLLSAE